MIFDKIKKRIPDRVKKNIYEKINTLIDLYALKSYSQEGEDMVLWRIFGHKPKGFYVDIGAHHPKRFSNTYFFYKRGWRGINIDAMPGGMALFRKYRKRDINLEIPISEHGKMLTYYMFDEPAFNSFSSELSLNRKQEVVKTIDIKTETLSSILSKYITQDMPIDFMSIDVEGLDLEVIASNNWDQFHPKIVMVEILNCSFDELSSSEISQYLITRGYIIYAKTVNTVFFMDYDFFKKEQGVEAAKRYGC